MSIVLSQTQNFRKNDVLNWCLQSDTTMVGKMPPQDWGISQRLLHNWRNRDRVCSTLHFQGTPKEETGAGPRAAPPAVLRVGASSRGWATLSSLASYPLGHDSPSLLPNPRRRRSRKPSGRSRHQADMWGKHLQPEAMPAVDTRPHWWDSFQLDLPLDCRWQLFKRKKRTSLKISHLKQTPRSFLTEVDSTLISCPSRFQASCWSSKVNSCLPQSPFLDEGNSVFYMCFK